MATDQRTVTAKRRAANQAAARKSTGPKSPQGKQRAAFNSFQHGAFASQDHILQEAMARSGSDSAQFDALRQSLLDDWQPSTAQQGLLVDDLAWFYWLRDQSALALVERRSQRHSRAQLERDQRRFNARHRVPSIPYEEDIQHGYVSLPSSENKFALMTALLDDLEDRLSRAEWAGGKETPNELFNRLYGRMCSTARGLQLAVFWRFCAAHQAGADDPHAEQIRTLIAEERASLTEEAELYRRRQELDIEQPEKDVALDPLDETWQCAVLGMERLDRQINAKIRLLIRLQEHAATTGSAELFSNSAALPTGEGVPAPNDSSPRPPGEQGSAELFSNSAAFLTGEGVENDGTKPSKSLESTTKADEARADQAFGLPLPGAEAAEEDQEAELSPVADAPASPIG